MLKLPSHQKAIVPKAVQQMLEKGGAEKPAKAKRKRQSSNETENLATVT